MSRRGWDALSLQHAALVLLFQNRPQLALELLSAAGVKTAAGGRATLENVDLTSAVPPEFRADLVVCYAGGKQPLVVVVEVQLGIDPDKKYSWPVYVSLLRARFRCETQLLVVAPRRAVARWARSPISIGNGAIFTPTVLGPDTIPVITDPAQARSAPELSVLSVLTHGKGEVEQAVRIGLASLAAVEALEPERGVLYFDLILTALGEAARKAIDAMIPQGYQWQSDFARKHRAEGKAEGQAEGKAQAVVMVLEARGIVLDADERERVLASRDLDELDRWLRRAPTVTRASELFERE